VYPAAGLMHYVSDNTPIYYIDPKPAVVRNQNINVIAKTATEGMKDFLNILN